MPEEATSLQGALQAVAALGLATAVTFLAVTVGQRVRTAPRRPGTWRALAGRVVPQIVSIAVLIYVAATWPAVMGELHQRSVLGSLLGWLVVPAVVIGTCTYLGTATLSELRVVNRLASDLLDRGLHPDEPWWRDGDSRG